ncbi:LOW QUALITY PROTEIN: calmodulin-binding transcription activator 1 [Anguilla anguilla]|uniref:LOW QUALITY PROTEIN: calmodulin-binding transcription activator 1 n=1 Tax=Anguilla anguilla TaxID=7936 RepID=UPI0015AF2DC9|nr:LOW QUALITY PROTEIN: calmodulin-binding transcription activator 1 [Anguilla anguilla]
MPKLTEGIGVGVGGWGLPPDPPFLPQNPDIVLVHYLNVPAIEDCGKPCGPILCSINTDKKEWAKWTKEELIGQLKPMFHGIKWTCSNGNSSTGFSVEQLVQQILDSHQTKPPPRTHNCLCTGTLGAGSSVHHKCNSAKHRIISPKMDARSAAYSSSHSELQNSDVSEGKTEHSHGGGRGGGGGAGGGAREKRNGKVPKLALLHQNSTEVSSTNQVEVPDTTQNSPVSISSGLNSDPDAADSPAMAGLGHAAAAVMGGLSQSVFLSEVPGDAVYGMSPTGGAGAHLLGPDAASQGLVLGVASDGHKFGFPGGTGGDRGGAGPGEGLAMLSGAGVGVSEELVLSSSLDAGGIKLPEAAVTFDPDCFLNNPKQGQTYGGGGLKVEGGASSGCASSRAGGSCDGGGGGLGGSPPLPESSYAFSSVLVKNIKTEDTSFEQQLAQDSAYQVGAAVSGGGGVSGSNGVGSAHGSLTLTPTGSLLPSGGGLSPSTTLEQMDFSAIDAKQDYSPAGSAPSAAYGQPVSSPQLAQHRCSPSFYLQEAPQAGPGGVHSPHDASAYLGLQVVKSDAPSSNGHLHHPHPLHPRPAQHRSCNGGSPGEGGLQLLQYQGGFPGLGAEHEEVVGLEQPGGAGADHQAGGSENGGEELLKAGDHLQACGGASGGGDGGGEHYLQQGSDGGGGGGGGAGGGGAGEGGVMHNGTASNRTGSGPPQQQQQQLQPLLQGAGLVQGLYGTQGLGGAGGGAGGGASGGVEISLDHFDISFGNQFSDLINDFISAEGGGASVGGGGAMYAHQLVAAPAGEGQPPSAEGPQQGPEEGAPQPETGYSPSELCLQPCCSPQSLGQGGAGGTAGGGAGGTDAGSLAYMHVAEVAQGTLGMIQAAGRLFMVTDYSPEWSYPEGGVKVLITGPWQETSSTYSCLFDQISVPASLIQPGVLRCYCPAHDTGLVTLQVAVSNQIISSSVVFEYKARALPSLPSSQHDWLSLDDNQFRMSILERLEQMEHRMAEMAGHQQQGSGGAAGTGGGGGTGGNSTQSQCVMGQAQPSSSFEGRVVVVCEKMMNRACWAKSKQLIHSKSFRGMTLLHLAAGQGYATLIKTLIKWRSKHSDSIDLELEVDPLNVDHFSCTPLMWACALGHLEAALVLFQWDRRALAIPDSLGRLPLAIARSRGHTKLAECLEQLQRGEEQPGPASLPPAQDPPAPPASDSWMVLWANDGTLATSGQKGTATANPNPDLRRPRSEPSSCYSSESQRDLPLAKKHKPNPELSQSRPDKAASVPLSLDRGAAGEGGVGGGGSQPKPGAVRGLGGAKGGSREQYAAWVSGRKGGQGKGGSLVSRLCPRDPQDPLEMLLSYREDLESQECLTHMDNLQVNMMTLAEHIIEATPERIKRENIVAVETVPLDSAGVGNTMSWLASYLGDTEHLPNIIHLRSLYAEPLTPSSTPSLSPGGSPLPEPGLPSPSEWGELLHPSSSRVERELAQLSLSDPEQLELYEAARLVQAAFRKYKGRPLREQQEVAAAVIQRCYRKYKQLTWIALKYALYKKMTQAAILIQSRFRSYHEQKKFRQSRRAAVLIQQRYRSYRECSRPGHHRRAAASAARVQHKLRSSLLTKKQDQAARKIMRFLRRCRHSPLMDHRLFKRSERIEKGQGT